MKKSRIFQILANLAYFRATPDIPHSPADPRELWHLMTSVNSDLSWRDDDVDNLPTRYFGDVIIQKTCRVLDLYRLAAGGG